MASLVTKEVEALRAVTDGQNLNSEQVGYLTRLANTEFGREVFLGKSQFEPQFVYDARTNPQPAQTPQPAPAQESAAQQEAQTAPLPPAALATMPVGAIRVPSFFSPRSAPVSFDDAIDINNLPENISSDQLRQALNQKAGDPAFELTESQNITRMRLNKKAGDEIDRAFIAANQAIPGLASLIGGAAKEWFLTTTGQPLGAAVADYVVTRMRAQDMRKQGPNSEADAAALEVQAQNQIAEYGDARLREAATLGESVRKSYINTRSLWNWARQFNDGMMSEGRKRDMLRDNLTANGILRNPEQELLSPDQRRSMQMENEIILQREWEARKAGETEDPALDAASEDEEYRRQHAAYVQNKALDRANLGIARFNRGGQEVEERADIRFADPVRFPSPFTDRLITPLENTATLGSIALDPLNAAGGVLGATTKWRLIHRTASVLGKPLTGIEKGAAGIRAAMEARREARIIGLAGRLGMKVDDARFAYDRSTRGLLNVATGGGVAGFGLGYLMSKDENFNQMGDALMVGGAILPALRGAGFVIRNTPKVAGVGGIIMQEAKAGPMGDISRIARNSTNHAEVIRAARPASAQELLQSGVVPPQYARHLRTYTDRAGDLNMAGGAARGADSTLKRVAQNPSNPENVRRFARLADQAGATGLVRALDDVASGTVAAGIGIAPFVAIAPEPEQAGSMIGGAVAFGAAGGLVGGRAGRAAEAFDVDVARTMVDLNAQGADVGTLFSLPRQSLEKIVNIQATAANKGVDLVLLRDEDYRANLPDVSQGTHMQRAGNVKHTVQEGDTLDALARRYYGTGEAWSRIVAANEGKIVENGGLPVGVELDMPGDNRWRMFVNMGHYSLEGGTVRVAKQADGTTRVSVMKDDGTSAYDFQTPNPEGLRVKDGQKVSAYEPLTNKIDRSLTAMHEFGHEVMRSDMFDGDHRIELRAIVQQIYGADGVQVRKRDYAARLVDREIESGVSEGVEFEFANEQERRDVRDGRVTIAQLRRQRGQQVKSRQELIDEKVAELEQDSVDRTGSPDAWIQDEIVNETLASEVNALELSRIRRGDNPEFFSARVGEAINTMTGRLLEFFGVKLNRSTGKPLDTPSTIFRENPLMKDPVLRKRLLEYVRDYDRYLVGLEDAGSANAKGARMAKSDRAEDFGNSPLVTLHPDPKTGRMENAFLFRGEDGKFYFKEQGDIDAAYKLQREQIRNMVRAQGSRKVPVGSGVFGMRTDDAGRTFVGGAKLPNEFDSMIHVPEHLRKFARALEEGATTGKSWIIQNHFVGSSDSGSYKLSRVRAGGRTIPREAVFINWKVTGADNILGVFLDLDAFRAATMKAINNNELPVFNNDIGVVQQKLLQLMDNHRNGRSGAAGLDASPDVAIEMKNTLNGLIGTGTAVQRSTDAFTSLNPRGSIRTYRLDRIDSVKPTGRTGLHADYDKINQNKMPDAEPVDGPINNNRMPSALPQAGMAMPETAKGGARGQAMPDVAADPKDVYARSLEDIKAVIPPEQRFVGNRTPGKPVVAPDGRPYLQHDLAKPTGNLFVTQADIDSVWEQSINQAGPSARRAVDVLAKRGIVMRPPDEAHWRSTGRLPQSDRFWYETSAEAQVISFPGFAARGESPKVMDTTAATSVMADPNYNAELTISFLSEDLRGTPAQTPAVVPKGVSDALIGTFGQGEQRKIGSFGGTFRFLAGLTEDPPLTTNDRQVAASFGVPDKVFGEFPILYEVATRFYGGLRDVINAGPADKSMGPFEGFQLQALSWVQTRAESRMNRRADIAQQEAFDGDPYPVAFMRSADKLRAGGVDVPRDAATGLPVFTDAVLSDPRVTEILAPTAKDFMRDTFQTMEIVTKLTKTGDRFSQLYDESRALGVKGNIKDADAVIARGMNALMTRKDYVDPEFIKLAMQVGPDTPYSIASSVLEQMDSRGALRAELGKKGAKATSVLTDLARVFDPRAEETTRIEFGLGTFQGDFSQNLRIPLGSVPEQYRAAYLAILGKPYAQAAQAASSFISTVPGGVPTSYSVFFRGRVDVDFLGQMAKRLSGAGHEANVSIRPNGIVVDVMPQFGDAGPMPIDPGMLKEMADAAAGDSTTASVIDRDFSSIYLERPNYAGEINKAKKGLLNESAREIGKITGARQAAARDFAAGTGPELSGNKAINRRAEKARDRYRQRLSQLESIQTRLKDMAKEFERDMAKANKVMEQKLERQRKAKKKPAQPAPAGLDDL